MRAACLPAMQAYFVVYRIVWYGLLTLRRTPTPYATEYNVFHRPASIQPTTGLQGPARRWLWHHIVQIHCRLLLQVALYAQG